MCILVALGLANLVPRAARFSLNIDLKRFAGISIPMVMSEGEYDNKNPIDQKLKKALESVPEEWGGGVENK